VHAAAFLLDVMLQAYKLQVEKLQENLAKATESLQQIKQGALLVSGAEPASH
jgi:hypothetical protein